MINKVVVNNFKSLKNLELQCTCLNLLMGMNGAGKSSFVQSLLFLRKCASLKRFEFQKVDLSNDLFDIGTDRDFFYAYNRDNATIGCCFDQGDVECSGAIQLKRGDGTRRSLEVEPDFFDGLRGSVISRIRYLSTDRLQIEQEKIVTGKDYNVCDFGARGENVLSYLQNRFWGYEHELDSKLWCDGCESFELQDQIDAWLQKISPGVSIDYDLEKDSDAPVVKVKVCHDNVNRNAPRFRPQNVGYGISYALYIITSLLTARAGEIIIIEDPEAHLHPHGQAAIGQLMVRAAAVGVQLFVETHSDHVVNGVRVAVKNGLINPGFVNIAYFSRDVHENISEENCPFEYFTSVKNIRIDHNGALSDYPNGFLDEWNVQVTELIR